MNRITKNTAQPINHFDAYVLCNIKAIAERRERRAQNLQSQEAARIFGAMGRAVSRVIRGLFRRATSGPLNGGNAASR